MRLDLKNFKKNQGKIIILVGLAVTVPVIFLSSACSKKQKPAQEIPPRPVKVAKSIKKDVPIYIDTFGNFAAPENVDIICQVTGKIKEVYFEEGQEVKVGAPLFLIDPKEYQAELDKSKAALEADRVELELKQEIYERNKKLYDKKLISQQDYDNYKTDVGAAQAQVALDQASVELAQINLDYCKIASPLNGVTGKRLVDPGNIVTANSGSPLVNIKAVDPLYLDFPIPERKLPGVKQAMKTATLKVEISPAGDSHGTYSGQLQMIDNTVDESTGTISLRAVVPNADRNLWPGQFANVKLIVSTAKDAVLVPGAAVQLGQKGMYAYVVTSDNKAELREDIEVGESEGDNLIIKKGIKVGEVVVTYGQMGLSPGAKVQVVPDDKNKKAGNGKSTPEKETK